MPIIDRLPAPVREALNESAVNFTDGIEQWPAWLERGGTVAELVSYIREMNRIQVARTTQLDTIPNVQPLVVKKGKTNVPTTKLRTIRDRRNARRLSDICDNHPGRCRGRR